MSAEHERETSHGGLKWFVLLACLPLFYLLSIGPVGALTKNRPGALGPARKVYYPVIWLHDHTFLKTPLETYARLWGFS